MAGLCDAQWDSAAHFPICSTGKPWPGEKSAEILGEKIQI